MYPLSVFCMGEWGILTEFADFVVCPACLCFFSSRDQPDSSRYSVCLILRNEDEQKSSSNINESAGGVE